VGGTSAKLKEGDILSIKSLFYGLMLPSGNDAAYCLAETFGQLLYLYNYDLIDYKNTKNFKVVGNNLFNNDNKNLNEKITENNT
jgi:hypothetical protein